MAKAKVCIHVALDVEKNVDEVVEVLGTNLLAWIIKEAKVVSDTVLVV